MKKTIKNGAAVKFTDAYMKKHQGLSFKGGIVTSCDKYPDGWKYQICVDETHDGFEHNMYARLEELF